MQPYIETERLIIRELLPTDIDGMFELDSDPLVHQYLGNQPVTDKSQSEAMIASIRQQYVDNGIGRWAMVEKATGEFIGWTGLKLIKEPTNGHIDFHDIGYRLIRKHWGKGFATESAVASLNYAFGELGLYEIFAAAHIGNEGSNKILRKVGLKWQGTFDYDETICNWYHIDRNGWETYKAF